MVWKAALVIGMMAAPAIAADDGTIDLICVGTASKDQEVGTIGSLLSGESNVQRVDSADSVRFHLTPSDTGTALLPKRLQSAYKEANDDGSFPLLKVARTRDEITGQIRLHAMYKPKFRLDRISGIVTITGTIADFSGKCEPYDPATVQRKF